MPTRSGREITTAMEDLEETTVKILDSNPSTSKEEDASAEKTQENTLTLLRFSVKKKTPQSVSKSIQFSSFHSRSSPVKNSGQKRIRDRRLQIYFSLKFNRLYYYSITRNNNFK